MENKTDNAIVQEAAVENTAPNAEIKKKRGRKPKNTIPQEVKTVDTVDAADKDTADEPSMDVEKDRYKMPSVESIQDNGGEQARTDADASETMLDNLAANGDGDNTPKAGQIIDVAEAMRRIMMFTEEMKAEAEMPKADESVADENNALKADDNIQNDTSLSNEIIPETEAHISEDGVSINADEDKIKDTDRDENSTEDGGLGDNGEGTGDDIDSREPARSEALSNDNIGENSDSFDGADAVNDGADSSAHEEADEKNTPAIESTDAVSEDTAEDDSEDDYGIEDEFGSIPDSFYEDDVPYPEDDNSSISALLYDDDDERIISDFEKRASISFSEIKEQMKKLKDEATELRAEETEKIPAEENTDEAEEAVEAETIDEIPEEPSDTVDAPEEEMPIKEIPEEAPIPEKKSYIRDIDRGEAAEEKPSEGRGEHIITIDRARVKDKEIPEGRLIDTVFEAVELFTFAILIIMILLSFVFRHTTVSGPSMLPTFNNGDRLIISNLFYEPKRGDVVVFDDRSNDAYEDTPIIKRIIGLEGDVVKIEGGIIMVKENGEDEFKIVNYVEDMEIPLRDMEEVTVGKGEMFVMGDNVNNSLDSTDRDENDPTRNVGNIKTDSILGKVLLRFYTVETAFSEETQEWVTKGRIVFDTKFTLK